MNKPQIQIGNQVRNMNDDELAQHELDKIESEAQAEAQAARQAARQAVLDKLGLTKEEAAALLG